MNHIVKKLSSIQKLFSSFFKKKVQKSKAKLLYYTEGNKKEIKFKKINLGK
jgi:hypothetical protein